MAQWFENWFDSAFYHKLYFDRDESEASLFIGNLMRFLNPPPKAYMLDVACGKGRHAKIMAGFGHFVTGIDISATSIIYAKQSENDDLEFFQHDMRRPFRINYYDYAFNLFTSFGYFNTQRENDDALRTIAQSLKPGGTLVIDFLNSFYVEQQLIAEEQKKIGDTIFNITRWKTNRCFFKKIRLEDPSLPVPLEFQEQVAAYRFSDFKEMLQKQNLEIRKTFGSYQLADFDELHSKRLIMIVEKKKNQA
jgi:SAM-dependent methyltransferase